MESSKKKGSGVRAKGINTEDARRRREHQAIQLRKEKAAVQQAKVRRVCIYISILFFMFYALFSRRSLST